MMLWGVVPLRTWARPTPASRASTAALTLGIMPVDRVPPEMSLRASSAVMRPMRELLSEKSR